MVVVQEPLQQVNDPAVRIDRLTIGQKRVILILSYLFALFLACQPDGASVGVEIGVPRAMRFLEVWFS